MCIGGAKSGLLTLSEKTELFPKYLQRRSFERRVILDGKKKRSGVSNSRESVTKKGASPP